MQGLGSIPPVLELGLLCTMRIVQRPGILCALCSINELDLEYTPSVTPSPHPPQKN
jgi:hypothetical protein